MSLAQKAHELEADGDIVGALQIYRNLYESDSADEEAILGIAGCALALEMLPTALEFYVRLLILNHDNAWGYLGRASVLFRYGQDNRALSDIASAIAKDRPATDLRIDAAALLNAHGCAEQAADVLRPIRNDHADNPDFMIEYACAFIAQKQTDVRELAPILEYFKAHRDDDPVYALILAACDLHRGIESARSECALILQNHPDLAEYAEILGVVKESED